MPDAMTTFQADFEKFRNGGSGPIAALRETGMRCFIEQGFPTTKIEEWKYTNVSAVAEGSFVLVGDALAKDDIAKNLIADWDRHLVVFVNGRFHAGLSRLSNLPAGVRVGSLADALAQGVAGIEENLGRIVDVAAAAAPFAALNTAFLDDGAFVSIPAGAVIETPIELLFLSLPNGAPSAAHPRSLILAGREAQAFVVESYAGASGAAYLANAVTEIRLAEGAVIDHYKVQLEGSGAFHVATMKAHLARGSHFETNSISFGGRLVRNDFLISLDDEGAETRLDGLYLAGGVQHMDHHTSIDHLRPHGTSREDYKGIIGGKAHGVFSGKVLVHPDAQKTDAQQQNRNLLLTRDAVVDTKPQLEIYADDVKCSHGATVGQLDETAVFYLRSRGLDVDQARNLLIYAFAGDIINRVRPDPLRENLERILLSRLSRLDEEWSA